MWKSNLQFATIMKKTNREYQNGYINGYTDGVKYIVRKSIKQYLRLIHLSDDVDKIVIKEIIKLIQNK